MNPSARLILVLILLCGWGCATQKPPAPPTPPAPSPSVLAAPTGHAQEGPAIAGDGVERIKVPLGGPSMGPATAKVTLVEFSDFQCPFCSRAVPTLQRIAADYPTEVRILFRHNPLSFHTNAALAAEAAVAAEAQGKFWEMHDKLFANQQALDRPSLDRYAQELGLDLRQVPGGAGRTRRQGPRRRRHRARPRRSAPTGRPTSSSTAASSRARSRIEEFKKVIDEEIRARGPAARRRHPARPALRDLHAGGQGRGRAAAAAQGPEAGVEVYRSPSATSRAGAGPRPRSPSSSSPTSSARFAAASTPTLDRLIRSTAPTSSCRYRHNPLPFHQNAMPAALAAEAAREQGKFWEMHDKLFANQQALDRASLEQYAQELGLDMAEFKAALDSDKGKDRIEARHGRGGQVRRASARPTSSSTGVAPAARSPTRRSSDCRRRDQEGRREAGRGDAARELYAALTRGGSTRPRAAPRPHRRASPPPPNATAQTSRARR